MQSEMKPRMTQVKGIIHASVGAALETPKHKFIRHFELMSPTLVADGKVVIREGHLTSLDDPEVRHIAQKRGEPDEILLEDWMPNPETAIQSYVKNICLSDWGDRNRRAYPLERASRKASLNFTL